MLAKKKRRKSSFRERFIIDRRVARTVKATCAIHYFCTRTSFVSLSFSPTTRLGEKNENAFSMRTRRHRRRRRRVAFFRGAISREISRCSDDGGEKSLLFAAFTHNAHRYARTQNHIRVTVRSEKSEKERESRVYRRDIRARVGRQPGNRLVTGIYSWAWSARGSASNPDQNRFAPRGDTILVDTWLSKSSAHIYIYRR